VVEGQKSLRAMISGDLLTKLENVWLIAKDSYHEAQKGDNIQGGKHCRTVEEYLGRLISDDKKVSLKPIGLFVLSAAACMHDIGKVVGDNCKGWQSDHGERSKSIILENYEKLGIDKAQAAAVSYIVSVHGNGVLDKLPQYPYAIGCDKLNLTELSAIFRLGDMLETTYQRAPERISDILFRDSIVPPKWHARQAITGWYLDDQNIISLQATPKTKEEQESAYVLWSMMKEDIAKLQFNLQRYGFPWEVGKLQIQPIYLEKYYTEKAVAKKPFPGMGYYTKDDSKIFKGREKEVEMVIANIFRWPISLLIGESGSGKTSLINAGVFPELEQIGWKCIWARPFDNPQDNLKKTLWKSFFEGAFDGQKTLLDVLENVTNKCKPDKLLIALDQFEDILNCPDPKEIENFKFDLTAIENKLIPNLKLLIAYREDASVKLNSRLLKGVTGTSQQFPSVELERLSREGARIAFKVGLDNAGISLDNAINGDKQTLLEQILDDIQQKDDRLYPPFLQMVAETLCKRLDAQDRVITREIYEHQLKGARSIIAHYLMNQLNEFGDQKEKAEKILIALTSSRASKTQKKIADIAFETQMSCEDTSRMLVMLKDCRMVRCVGDNDFELIHDYLGKIIDQELVEEKDRKLKFISEQLDFYQQGYKVNQTLISEPRFMSTLYKNRKAIKVSEEMYPLLLASSLWEENGSCWYFLRDIEKPKLLSLLKEQMDHPLKQVSITASNMFIDIITHDEIQVLIELFKGASDIREIAAEAFLKIVKREDKQLILELIKNNKQRVREIAIRAFAQITETEDRAVVLCLMRDYPEHLGYLSVAFAKVANSDDRQLALELLRNKEFTVRSAAAEAFVRLALPSDMNLLTELVLDSDYYIQDAAARAILKVAQRNDIDLLIKLLKHNQYHIQEIAVQAFTKIVLPSGKGLILKLLIDKNSTSSVQIAAGKAFEKMASHEDMDLVATLMIDQNHFVREAANASFLKIATYEDKERILALLSESSYDIRIVAAKALAKIVQSGDRSIILKLLNDKDAKVQEAAAEAAVTIAGNEDTDLIVKLVKHSNYNIQVVAARKLFRLEEDKDDHLLFKLLHEKTYGVVAAITKAIIEGVQLRHRRFVYKMLNDESSVIQLAGAKALAKIALPKDRAALLDYACINNDPLRQATLETLAKITEKPEDREALLELLSDKAHGWTADNMAALKSLADLDRLFYCPASIGLDEDGLL
jgi:HEAT repeat protein